MKVYYAHRMYDGLGRVLEGVYIGVEKGKISYISNEKREGEVVGEFPVVTPAFIDAHSHIGMMREGEPINESEGNDYADSFQPLLNPLDSIYFDDVAFKNAVEAGVLYSCVIPGSGNIVGGKAVVIRNFAKNRKEAFLKDYGYKLALGYNPRSVFDAGRGKRFNTRMGFYAYLEYKLDEILRKKRKQELNMEKELKEFKKKLEKQEITEEEFNEKKRMLEEAFWLELDQIEKSILELLEGKKVGKVHVHKADDVLYLIELKNKFNLKVTADHLGDIFEREIFEELKKESIPIVYGPISSFAYKVELKHSSYKNVKHLIESGAFFGLMTDHPVVLASLLFYELRYFLLYGMKKEEAISIITSRNAKILGIDDMVGSLEEGKYASFILWNGDPFELTSRPELVVAEGKEITPEL